MKKKIIACLLLLCLGISLLTACGGGKETPSTPAPAAEGSAQPGADAPADDRSDWVSLNLAYTTFQGDTAVGNKNMYLLQDKINERMDGLIQFEYYYSGTLCSNVDTLDGIISGVADAGFVTVGNYPGRLPYSSFFDQCGIKWNNTTAASYAMKEFLEHYDPEELADVKVLWYSVATPGVIASTRPIRTVDDFKGMTIRSTSTTTETVAAMGATPVTLEWSECYEALRNGMVDGLYTIIGACGASLIQEVAPYATHNPFYTTSYMFVMNRGVYESMPESQRALFDELVEEVQDEYASHYSGLFDGDERSMNYFKGIEELIFLDGAELEKLEGLVGGQIESYAKSLDDKGMDGTGALEYLRELADKYNTEYPAEEYEEYLKSFLPES